MGDCTDPKREGLVHASFAQSDRLPLAVYHCLRSELVVQPVIRQASQCEQSPRRMQTSILCRTRCVRQFDRPEAPLALER